MSILDPSIMSSIFLTLRTAGSDSDTDSAIHHLGVLSSGCVLAGTARDWG